MTKNKDILKKAIKDLTIEDFKALEKPLGTLGHPFPMWGPMRIEDEKSSEIETVLSFIASDANPMMIYSERPYDEVMALAYCDMPVPSMLPLFKDGLERRGDPLQRQKDMLEGKIPQNDNFNRTQMMIGDPGAGKSFLGAHQGRLRSNGKVEVFDCGGKNMNDLLFEMVLDFGAGDSLPKAIDKRLQAGTLEGMSVALLKTLPEKHVTMDDKQEKILSIDWEGLKTAGTDEVEKAFEVLKKVSAVEGLDNAGGNALGMNSQYGALIRAYLENREIVLDEYNKSREGSDNALQTVIQFMIGEIRETTVENPLKNKDNTSGPSGFTFKRDAMGAGFFVTFTGNKTEDGITTRSLNRSVYDRLKPDTLPDPSIIDWQHRICQLMVGVPVSTLYTVFKEAADQDPDGFGDWLLQLRRKKAEIEGAPVPELQETLLKNWKNVVESTQKLAMFYDRWAGMTAAELITSNGNADLIDEVDEEYSKKEAMSFRRIKQHLEEAIPLRARMEAPDVIARFDFKSWGKQPKLAEGVAENASLHFGTRLVEYIERMVYEKSGAVGKHKLYSKLRKSMEEFGLRDITLQEGSRGQTMAVEQALNISAFSDRNMSKQAEMARKIFCGYIRQINPDIKAEDDQIATPKTFLDALEHVSRTDTAAGNRLFVANSDPESMYNGQPLVDAIIKDGAVYVREERDIDFPQSDVVGHDDFLASLALPTVSAKNLSAIWEQNIRPLTRSEPAAPAAANGNAPAGGMIEHDEAMLIAENRSKYGIGVTSLQVLHSGEGEDKVVSVHIVRNEARGKTLVVSEKAPSKLLSAFREAGVIHVDRNAENAASQIDAAIMDLTRGMPASVRDRMLDAFLYRNDVQQDETQDDAAQDETQDAAQGEDKKAPSLSEMMTDPKVGMVVPKFVVRTASAGKGPRP